MKALFKCPDCSRVLFYVDHDKHQAFVGQHPIHYETPIKDIESMIKVRCVCGGVLLAPGLYVASLAGSLPSQPGE